MQLRYEVKTRIYSSLKDIQAEIKNNCNEKDNKII